MSDKEEGEMSLIGFRFTHSLIPECDSDEGAKRVVHIMKQAMKNWRLEKYVWCIEYKDKFGKDTKPHIHFHGEFENLPSTDGVRKSFKREFEKNGIQITGAVNRKSALWAISRPAVIEDEDAWWRYCMKQPGSKLHYTENYKEFAKKWKVAARTQWQLQVEQNNKAVDNFLDKNSFKGKMFEEFKKEGINTERDFVIRYIKYCFEKSKTPSYTKINDYWIEYQMKIGLMSVEEWVDEHYFK